MIFRKSFKIFFIIILFSGITNLYSQVESIYIYHPVYKFLFQLENYGLTGKYNLNDLPLKRNDIVNILKFARQNINKLSANEIKTLEIYENEFEIVNNGNNTVLIESNSDSTQILFSNLFSNKEKYIFLYRDSSFNTRLRPIGSVDLLFSKNDSIEFRNALIGNLGFRFSGTIDNSVGYNLQATNGVLLSGNREIAYLDPKYSKNIKFVYYQSDIDFTESHINYKNNWFTASIGRESRLLGTGFLNRMIVSDNSPAFDALSLTGEFPGFKYKFMHSSLLGFVNQHGTWQTGFGITIPSKYLAIHRFSLLPSWGEISFWETIVYSDRPMDLAYLNPLSFLKSLEHALRDRDNAGMGLDLTVRFLDRFQLKGSYFLDDVRFEMIGKNYWGNKSAFNIGLSSSLPYGLNAGIEYSRVEPFTFSHFNRQNSMVNDGFLFGTSVMPNSDKFSLFLNWWFCERYPLELEISYLRHGRNIYDNDGNIIKNVGGDPLITKEPEHSGEVTFLDGDVLYMTSIDLKTAYELVRGFNLVFNYKVSVSNDFTNQFIRLILRFDEF